MNYTELQVTTNFSFLRGASHPEEMVEQAEALGYTALAITDYNSLAGIVRAYAAARGRKLRLIPACRLELLDGPPVLAYPVDRPAYAELCGLLTTGNLRAEKGKCFLYKADLFALRKDFRFIMLPPTTLDERFDFPETFKQELKKYRQALGEKLYLAAARSYEGDDMKRLFRIQQLSLQCRVPAVAVNDVHYHHPSRRELQDVVTCIREKCTIHTAGYRLHLNAERYLKAPEEMGRLFRQYPAMVRRAAEIAEACRFSLDELKYEYPEEITSEGRTPQEELTRLAWMGAKDRYGGIIPEKIVASIRHELKFIGQMQYAPYFLTVYDIVRFARSRDILCQGRGSAANSTVCYCLGITSVDPTKFDLLFERFVSAARNEPPDIDVDFEHERREEVIQYIYEKYGRDRAAIVATVTQQHQKGSVRDVAKAMGLSLDMINRLSSSIWYFDDDLDDKRVKEQGFNPHDPHLKKILELTRQFMGFPRQLGQHTGGFVMTRSKLNELVPVLHARMENRTCIEWNKDDIDTLGFMKVDVLALGMLTCIRKAFQLARKHYGLDLTLANIPQDDPAVYDMICRADTMGVFQIESRAQMSMLPRLRPREFYDLVIEVAIVRPGPIQGDMVHPYLRRRNNEEAVDYPSEELRSILSRTLGVPLFQEQAMKIAIVAAGFTPVEADQLRRSMATFKAHGKVGAFEEKLIKGMTERGYSLEYSKRVFRQLEGFGSYGFPESHAVSFALLVYISSWLKCHYPDVFGCALLNSQPMGFYQPAQLVRDAQKHGVKVRPVDVNYSEWDNLLEGKDGQYHALRLGFRQVKGMRQEDADLIVANRQSAYTDMNALRDIGISDAVLERLADADAFRSMGLDRRQALWEATVKDRPVSLFAGQASPDASQEAGIRLPAMSLSEHVVQDYASTSLSLKAHPVSFVREKLKQLYISSAEELGRMKDGDPVKIAGLVLVRQRPGTASGICFITIEDETGVANLVVFEKMFNRYRKEILQSGLLMVEGRVQREREVIHVVVQRCYNFSKLLRQLRSNASNAPTLFPDEGEKKIYPEGRNFR